MSYGRLYILDRSVTVAIYQSRIHYTNVILSIKKRYLSAYCIINQETSRFTYISVIFVTTMVLVKPNTFGK